LTLSILGVKNAIQLRLLKIEHAAGTAETVELLALKLKRMNVQIVSLLFKQLSKHC